MIKLFIFSFTGWREWLVHVDTNQYVVASKQSLSIIVNGMSPDTSTLCVVFLVYNTLFCKMERVGQISVLMLRLPLKHTIRAMTIHATLIDLAISQNTKAK